MQAFVETEWARRRVEDQAGSASGATLIQNDLRITRHVREVSGRPGGAHCYVERNAQQVLRYICP